MIKKLLDFIFNIKYDLKLPNSWNNKNCFDCGKKLNKKTIFQVGKYLEK